MQYVKSALQQVSFLTSSRATEMELAPPLTIPVQAPHQHTSTVVFLHGRGDNKINFHRALSCSPTHTHESIFTALPSTRFVFPQAPIRPLAADPSQKWTQWFDVWSTQDFNAREDLTIAGLKEVIPPLRKLLAAEAELLGGRWDRIVLMGISMGGATGAHLLMNLEIPKEAVGERRLGAWVGFSARCPLAGRDLAGMRAALGVWDGKGESSVSEVLSNTPMMLQHCVNDPLVPVRNGWLLRDTMAGFGANIAMKEYSDGGHWFNIPQGLDDAVRFLKQHVQGMDAAGKPSAVATGDAMDMS